MKCHRRNLGLVLDARAFNTGLCTNSNFQNENSINPTYELYSPIISCFITVFPWMRVVRSAAAQDYLQNCCFKGFAIHWKTLNSHGLMGLNWEYQMHKAEKFLANRYLSNLKLD